MEPETTVVERGANGDPPIRSNLQRPRHSPGAPGFFLSLWERAGVRAGVQLIFARKTKHSLRNNVRNIRTADEGEYDVCPHPDRLLKNDQTSGGRGSCRAGFGGESVFGAARREPRPPIFNGLQTLSRRERGNVRGPYQTALSAAVHLARNTPGGRQVALLHVVHHHPVGTEPPAQRADRMLHVRQPVPG
jgi:hypothetical protein